MNYLINYYSEEFYSILSIQIFIPEYDRFRFFTTNSNSDFKRFIYRGYYTDPKYKLSLPIPQWLVATYPINEELHKLIPVEVML